MMVQANELYMKFRQQAFNHPIFIPTVADVLDNIIFYRLLCNGIVDIESPSTHALFHIMEK